MTEKAGRTIRTSFVGPFTSACRWQAWYVDDEEGKFDVGLTEQGAIADLENKHDVNVIYAAEPAELPPIQMLGELRPGSVYAVRITRELPIDMLARYAKALEDAAPHIGVKFIIFTADLEPLNAAELGEVVRAEIRRCTQAFSDAVLNGASCAPPNGLLAKEESK